MPITPANGIDIAYVTHGDPSSPPLLTIHGLGAQLTDFPAAAIEGLVDAGFFVITFDNRDQGGSTWFDDAIIVSRLLRACAVSFLPVSTEVRLSSITSSVDRVSS